MNTIDIKHKNSLNIASRILLKNGVMVFPTDTVYGIGCLLNKTSIVKLYKIKNRSLSQPTAILISKKIWPKIIIDNKIEKGFLTGKVTLLIKKELINIEIPDILIKDSKVGVRMPKYPWLEHLIDKTGPIVASSANKKGEPTPGSLIDINNKLLEQTDLVIKTDQISSNSPSIIYDIEKNKIIRP